MVKATLDHEDVDLRAYAFDALALLVFGNMENKELAGVAGATEADDVGHGETQRQRVLAEERVQGPHQPDRPKGK